VLRQDRDSDGLAPADPGRHHFDRGTSGIDARASKLFRDERADLGVVAAELAGIASGMHRDGVLSEPSLENRPELEDREEQRNE
jgi:hypothetical protein